MTPGTRYTSVFRPGLFEGQVAIVSVENTAFLTLFLPTQNGEDP